MVQSHDSSLDDGSPWQTINFQHLNAQCQRETHYTFTPFQLASQIPPNTKKSIIDVVDGFHSIGLDESSQPVTTFITEWGWYMYRQMPWGFIVSGDVYTHRLDGNIEQIPRKVKIVDDTLLYDKSIEEAFFHVWDCLTVFAENRVVANSKKFQFCKDSINFAGLTITPTRVTPSDRMLSLITDFQKAY